MILRARYTPRDLTYLSNAVEKKLLARERLEEQKKTQINLGELLPGFFPREFPVTVLYTHAPLRKKYFGLKRENAIQEYFRTWAALIPDSLERLRLLKIPHLVHIDAGWELPAIRAILRRRIDDSAKARAIIRLAASGLAKHPVGDVRRIPYEVVMAHFAHPDAAAAYDPWEKVIHYPSPSAVEAMKRGEHRLISDLVNTLAHEGAHVYADIHYRTLADDDLGQIMLDTFNEAVASAFGDLVAYRLAGGKRPRKSFADWYIKISNIPLHRDAFKHIYWTVVREGNTVEEALRAGIAAAREFGIHVEPRDRI
ncbi:MAG: hypothetical protein GXN93_05125 [Candidatus Diapherotrites archaeon]|nr:hypothetical protein [Candidatus Diapherotrites archaeon]